MPHPKSTSFRKGAEPVLTILTVLAGVGLGFYVVSKVMIVSAFGGFDEDYSISDLKKSFEDHKAAIYDLKYYVSQIVPKNRLVEIEFDDDHTLSRFGVGCASRANGEPIGNMHLYANLDIDNRSTEQTMQKLGWTRHTLHTLKRKLDDAGCIGIVSGEPLKINFQRSGLGMYSFDIFDGHIPDSLRAQYNDSCAYILVNDRLVLEYGGGAVGNQCFYKFN